jgi:hypothetical protein
MSAQPLLKSTGMIESAVSAHQEAVNQLARNLLWNMLFNQNRKVHCPAKRYGRIIQIEETISVTKTVLSQHDVFGFFSEQSDKYAPAFDGHVDGCSRAAALAYTRVAPFTADKVPWA